jgi:GAF domain-containing protein
MGVMGGCSQASSSLRAAKRLISVEDMGAIISLRLKHTILYDAFALYCVNDDVLVPAFVIGKNSEVLATLRIPIGEGLSGWVAQNRRLILNGNPSVEPGYLKDSTARNTMLSALVVPLEVESRVTAVLALYRAGRDAFIADDLRVLEAIRADLGSAVSEAQRSKTFEASSGS